MAYRFKLDERIGKGLTRVGREQLERALKELAGGEAGTAVHEARKCIKRLRALLRLIRAGIAKEDYRQLNAGLRDAGRALSASRDDDVVKATLARIALEAPEVRAPARKLAAALGRRRSSRTAGDPATDRQQAVALLQTALKSWRHLELADDSFAPLAAGLDRGLEDLGEACAAAESGSDEAVHDWRKAVQRHWRHMRLVEAGWPEYFGARAAEARTISGLLGDAQDLTLLLALLDTKGRGGLASSEAQRLRKLASARRDMLRNAARAHSSRLLAEGAKAHARRAATLWHAAATLDPEIMPAPPIPRSAPPAGDAARHALASAPRVPRKLSPRARRKPRR